MSRWMSVTRSRSAGGERGQVLVIVASGLLALIAMVGLVIDGGHAWGRQRVTQNGADAIAKAGTVPILEWLAGDSSVTIGDIGCAVEAAEEAGGVDIEQAEITNHTGTPIGVTVPACGTGGAIPDDAQGIRAVATLDFDTFLMGVVGFDSLTARANATAVVGPVTGLSVVLPVTFPQTIGVCDDTDDVYTVRDWNEENDPSGPDATVDVWDPYEILPDGAERTSNNLAIVPLCDTGPGSVGWLDYGCGNTSESISNPCDVFLHIPDWILTQTGNINCCEDELAMYHGDEPGTYEEGEDVEVKLPIHRVTCRDDAGTSGSGVDRVLNECTTGPGDGNNLWYGVEFWVGFVLDEAHVQGGDNECEDGPGTPRLDNPGGQVGCLKGWFVQRFGLPEDVSIGDVDPDDEIDLGITLIN